MTICSLTTIFTHPGGVYSTLGLNVFTGSFTTAICLLPALPEPAKRQLKAKVYDLGRVGAGGVGGMCMSVCLIHTSAML